MSGPQQSQIPIHLEGAVKEIFQVQIGEPAVVDSVTLDKAGQISSADNIAVMSVLSIMSSEFEGSLSIGFPQATFLAVVEKMLGEKFATINSENADACGEILNIIYAGARVKINDSGFDFSPAIPTTVFGSVLALSATPGKSIMKLKCHSASGPFVIALHLKKK